ncbi:MAG: pre-peptidase C-terminal domain-containing protein [Planctomycetaceae bacterium]|nr:pre-peptidase C-terminal domain-containing protein [Planctomycetaceae bacterium]
MMRLAAALSVLFVPCWATTSLGQAPTVSHTLPYAVAPGKAVKLTFYGDNLADARDVWTNLPGAKFTSIGASTQASNAKGDSKAKAAKIAVFEATVPALACPGIYGVRLVGPLGASNLRLILVDDLGTTAEDTSNKSVSKAQKLSWPTAVDGVYEAETYDFYTIHVEAGRRISVEAVARRLGSPLDPVIRMLDAAGHELAYADDDESTGPDGRFIYRIQKSGDYTIEVRDIRYAGSGAHRYRLRVGDFPLLAAPYPMGVQAGTTALVEPIGFDLGPLAPIRTAVPADCAAKQLPLAVAYDQKSGSGLAMLSVSHAAEQTEVEPNQERAEASPLVLAGAVNGRFEQPADRDRYGFEAKKGLKLRFTGQTRGFGSPADLFLRIFDKDGKVLAEAEDTGTDEGSLDFTFPADGKYYLSVEDLLGRGGPQYSYRVLIGPAAPSFTLALDAEKLDVPHSGVAKVKVTAARNGYKGPIKLALKFAGEPADLKATGVIPEGKPDATLVVTAGPSLAVGTFLNVDVVGEGSEKDSKEVITATALATTAFKTALGGLTSPPLDLAENLAISIGPPAADFMKVTAVKTAITLPQLIGKASLPVKIEKLNKFDDVVTLTVEGLPPGVTAAAAKIEKGKTEATIELTGPTTSAPLEQTIRVSASAVFNDQPKKVTTGDVTLRIGAPLEATAAKLAPLAPGQKQKLKINVVRHGGDAQPITLRWKSLPRGVTGAAEFVVPADKTETETELAVDAKAPFGPSAGRLTATTKIAGRTVTLDVGTIALDVAPPTPKQTAAKQTAAK